jgi:hypothetical protein
MGRATVALADDPQHMTLSGQALAMISGRADRHDWGAAR